VMSCFAMRNFVRIGYSSSQFAHPLLKIPR
jgi:hypothetical protein